MALAPSWISFWNFDKEIKLKNCKTTSACIYFQTNWFWVTFGSGCDPVSRAQGDHTSRPPGRTYAKHVLALIFAAPQKWISKCRSALTLDILISSNLLAFDQEDLVILNHLFVAQKNQTWFPSSWNGQQRNSLPLSKMRQSTGKSTQEGGKS